MSELILFILELVGIAAFAASGAMRALAKKMDIFGVATLGVITAVGGGVIRDVVLGNTPPETFRNPVYALVAVLVSVIIFIPAVRKVIFIKPVIYDMMMLVMDSVGLGIFTVVGIQSAYAVNAQSGMFLLVFVGMITGIGGGVIRDVLAGDTPYVFVKHFYACASLIGSVVCVLFWRNFGQDAAIIGGALVVVVLRLLAAKFHWSLPKADSDPQIKED